MNTLFLNAYKDKIILITGHTGFKGSWLSLLLAELGAKIVGYSLEPPTKPNLFGSINLKDKITHIIGDVRDEKHLISVFEKYCPEFIFHLAAQPLVRFSYKEPKLTYETNVIGTLNILETIRKTKSVKVCIIVTSDKCYENKEWVYGYRETDPLGGYDPYSSSKSCAELITTAYRHTFFNSKDFSRTHNVALSTVRAGNMMGGGDWGEDRIIPDCVRALSKGQTIIIRNPSAIRPWQYVLEPLSGYLLLGALMYKHGTAYSDRWNFGPEDTNLITVEELTKSVIKCWGDGNYKIDNSCHPYEAKTLKLDISKARGLLGWKPIYDIYETVDKTINWYKSFYNSLAQKELLNYILREIREYIFVITNERKNTNES